MGNVLLALSDPQITLYSSNEKHAGVEQLCSLLQENSIPFCYKVLAGMKHAWRGEWLEPMLDSE